MNDIYKLAEKILTLLLPFILMYIIASYTGYELYILSETLIKPEVLPSTVFYWIVAKCCFFGFLLSVVNVLGFIALYFNIETIFREKEGRADELRVNGWFKCDDFLNLLKFPVIGNTNRYLFTKLQNYLFADLDEDEKILFLKLRDSDINHNLFYNKILQRQIICRSDISKILDFIRERLNDIESNLSTKDEKTLEAVIKKLELMMDFSLTEMNINYIMKCYTPEYSEFHDLINRMIRQQNIDSHREEIHSFIKNKNIQTLITAPIENSLKKLNNLPSVVELVSMFSPVSFFCVLGIYLYSFHIISSTLMVAFVLGEIVVLVSIYYFDGVCEINKLTKTIWYLITLIVCFVVPILIVTPIIVKYELESNKWFSVVSESDNRQLFVDDKIINQLKLKKYRMIDDCVYNESVFCYLKTKESSNYLQLRNFSTLYMLNLNESSAVYLKDNYGRMFNLNLYGNYYYIIH